MFVLLVVVTLVISKLWVTSTEQNTRVYGVDVHLSRVLNSQNNSYVMQINKFDSSINVYE